MDGGVDYRTFDDTRLVEALGRIDRHRAPVNFAALTAELIERGYTVHASEAGPAFATMSAQQLRTTIGQAKPLSVRARFGPDKGLVSWLEPPRNDFRYIGSGLIEVDGLHVRLSARRFSVFFGFLGLLFRRNEEFQRGSIANVEDEDEVVRFECRPEAEPARAVTVWLADASEARQLAEALPETRTQEFRPQLAAHREFERRLTAQLSRPNATLGLIGVNVLVGVLTLIVGNQAQFEWGANFGPFTTGGEWWRLLTSMFLHAGFLHLVFNMWALASFGPMVERLFGSVSYLFIFIVSGLASGLASIWWHPAISSVGASGAIFGILGALLASQLRVGDSIPTSVLRPLQLSTLIFTGVSLSGGLADRGVDNAAHIGGLAIGCVLGLALARPVTGERSYTRAYAKRWVLVVPLAFLLVGAGVLFAEQASHSPAGAGLYWRTFRWFGIHELEATNRWIAIKKEITTENLEDDELRKRISTDVLPFWHDAVRRWERVEVLRGTPQASDLEYIREVSRGRAHGFETTVEALRLHDAAMIETATQEQARIDELIGEHERTAARSAGKRTGS